MATDGSGPFMSELDLASVLLVFVQQVTPTRSLENGELGQTTLGLRQKTFVKDICVGPGNKFKTFWRSMGDG